MGKNRDVFRTTVAMKSKLKTLILTAVCDRESNHSGIGRTRFSLCYMVLLLQRISDHGARGFQQDWAASKEGQLRGALVRPHPEGIRRGEAISQWTGSHPVRGRGQEIRRPGTILSELTIPAIIWKRCNSEIFWFFNNCSGHGFIVTLNFIVLQMQLCYI